jgi:hypothetical protein
MWLRLRVGTSGGRGRLREERRGEKQGIQESPGSHIEKTCVLGKPRRTTFYPCSQSLPNQPCAHVCTALDLPCFRHVALQTTVGKAGTRRPPPPSTPLSRPPHFGLCLPSPPPAQEGYLQFDFPASARRFGRGRKGGGGVCVGETYRGTPK